mgnify:CR=1 FL=1
MKEDQLKQKLSLIYARSPVIEMQESDKTVVFSDLHMGGGGIGDDFLSTSDQFTRILDRYYHDRGYNLVLNGDVEDLYKFKLRSIVERWKEVYDLFRRFMEETSMFKLVGNHDWNVHMNLPRFFHMKHHQALRIKVGGAALFLLHGHQASPYIDRFANLSKAIARNVAKPMGIRNTSLKITKDYISPLERRLSEFSLANKVLSFMGHTHKPHFGYFSKIPGVFNSGCSMGRKGISALEIERGKVSLVHWVDSKLSRIYGKLGDLNPFQAKGTGSFRIVLDSASINSIIRSVNLQST